MITNVDDYIDCKICKEKIHKDAIICTHCNSFQNWRRHLGLSSSFLSILLALISVSTVFITVLANTTIKNDSDINASIINWQRTYFNDRGKMVQVLVTDIFVTNNGKKPGAIKAFSIKGAGDREFEYFQSGKIGGIDKYSHKRIETQIVESGKTLILKKYLTTYLEVNEFKNKYSNSVLLLEIINFSGETQDIVLEVKNSPPTLFK